LAVLNKLSGRAPVLSQAPGFDLSHMPCRAQKGGRLVDDAIPRDQEVGTIGVGTCVAMEHRRLVFRIRLVNDDPTHRFHRILLHGGKSPHLDMGIAYHHTLCIHIEHCFEHPGYEDAHFLHASRNGAFI